MLDRSSLILGLEIIKNHLCSGHIRGPVRNMQHNQNQRKESLDHGPVVISTLQLFDAELGLSPPIDKVENYCIVCTLVI